MKPQNSLITTRKRLLILFISITFLFFALFGRLGYLQLIKGKEFQAKAAEQWYRDLPLAAPRGKILDRNGAVLADNRDVFSVYVRPRSVESFEAVSKLLSDVLELNYEKLYNKLSTTHVSEITVLKSVDEDKAKIIKDRGLKGIYLTMDSKRSYPNGYYFSQILGFTNIDNVGQNGLEGYYDKYLKGVNGFAYTSTDIKGNELDNNVTRYVPAIAGCDIVLSSDKQIQAFAESAVSAAMTDYEAKSASMIVMDCTNGGVLAMASAPSFDLNDPPRDDINMLNSLSKNKMIVDVYEPGSTFKIFTTAAALEKGKVSDNDRFYCAGNRTVDGQRIKCWRSIGHGSQALSEGVKNSCNCVFMDLALRLGVKELYSSLRDFGFGAKTNIDFFGESKGLLMNEKNVKNVDLARIGFGQAVAVTPLQLVTGVSSVVNGGTLYKPHFVNTVTSPIGKTLLQFDESPVRRVIKKETSAKMNSMLENVVANGSGKKAAVDGYRIGGKTGTAQKYENGKIAQGKYVSSFIGFAPVEDPKYVVLMIVDEPGPGAYYGSIVAAPYAGRVFKNIFDYEGRKPAPTEPKEKLSLPNMLGITAQAAVAQLEKLGFKVELAGEGEKIKSMLPLPDTQVFKGDVILLRTE